MKRPPSATRLGVGTVALRLCRFAAGIAPSADGAGDDGVFRAVRGATRDAVSGLCDFFEKNRVKLLNYYRFSNSLSHKVAQASDGIRQSPRGDKLTLPTLGPSGRQLRLNCCWKNRR